MKHYEFQDTVWRIERIVSVMANNPHVNLLELIERGELDDVLDVPLSPGRTRKQDLRWLIYWIDEARDYLADFAKMLERVLLKMD
jgi:hypothetical protein